MIELRDATVEATTPDGRLTILHPTTLTITEQRISVIGANGSGKSTFARLLNGLVEPSSGSVRIRREREPASPGRDNGEGDTRDRDADAWLDTVADGAAVRRLVGFTFSDPGAQLVMPTAIEDVALSLRRRYRRRAERDAAARAALERFGIAELAERSVHTLSGGQRQLLAIASVLAADPAILIADEPTTLLDLRNGRMIGDLLMRLPQQVVVVTHDLDLAVRADRTLVVEGGRVVFNGDPAEAVAHYRSLE